VSGLTASLTRYTLITQWKEFVQKKMKQLALNIPFMHVGAFQRNQEVEWTGKNSYITRIIVCILHNKWSQCAHICNDITGAAAADNNRTATIKVIRLISKISFGYCVTFWRPQSQNRTGLQYVDCYSRHTG